MTTTNIEGIAIPDSKLAREVTELVKAPNRRCCFIIPAGFIISAP
jgi:hypothetical protein